MMNNLVANNLQLIRKEQNLSLDKLADLSGVSKSMLRQIEMGKSSPTVATLWKIANGLHIPMTALLREESSDVILQKLKDGTPIKGSSDQFRLLSLIPFDPKRAFEIYYLEIDPDASLESEPHNGNPEEYVFVTHGTITVAVGDEVYEVEQGRFLRFHANRPHRYQNIGTEVAKVINLIAYLS
jgi:transcriptional regulator with XRE-family HTH domain